MTMHSVPLALTLAMCSALPALAQTDQIAMAHTMAANQLGLLQYCQGQGDVDASAVEAERSMIGRMPPSAAPTDAAEALGRKGTLSANGTTMTLASMASSHNTTVSALCKQMGSSAVQASSAYQQNGAAKNGMPSLPGGMTMPQMPGGMPSMPSGMPSMGSLPGMPGAPPAK